MKTPFTTLTCMTLLLGIALSARAQMEIPKPAPELKKLNYFAGRWTAEGDIKPGPMGSGGNCRFLITGVPSSPVAFHALR
jgi:hypothetical protein